MNKPHKHARVIKAWADGAEIECRYPTDTYLEWTDTDNPRIISATWHEDGSFVEGNPNNPLDPVPQSRTVTLYQALVRTMEGCYFSPYDLFSGLDDDGIEDWNSGGYKVIRLLTEYPIEVEQ